MFSCDNSQIGKRSVRVESIFGFAQRYTPIAQQKSCHVLDIQQIHSFIYSTNID